MRTLFLTLALMIVTILSNAHGGGTDSKGGHTDKATGKYHLHNQLNETALKSTTIQYNRDDFGGWIDSDNDCLDTRAEILLLNTLGEITTKDCLVITGKWWDDYSGKFYYLASDLDIDHIIPLKWAFERGANTWSKQQKVKFANDSLNLKPVQDRLNQSKGAKPPSEWMPPNNNYRCKYLDEWVVLLTKYQDLQMTSSEKRMFNRQLKACKLSAP